jgi:hypothetical protein
MCIALIPCLVQLDRAGSFLLYYNILNRGSENQFEAGVERCMSLSTLITMIDSGRLVPALCKDFLCFFNSGRTPESISESQSPKKVLQSPPSRLMSGPGRLKDSVMSERTELRAKAVKAHSSAQRLKFIYCVHFPALYSAQD